MPMITLMRKWGNEDDDFYAYIFDEVELDWFIELCCNIFSALEICFKYLYFELFFFYNLMKKEKGHT